MMYIAKTAILLLLFLSACAKNPVTGKQELHFISANQEIKMGSKQYQYAQQASGGRYTLDPELSAYVNEVGKKLVSVSDRKDLPFEFVVLNDSVPNAWALPGGKIAVNRGLLTSLENEAELAAVLGHEITHVAARHSAKAFERQVIISTGLATTQVALAVSTRENKSGQITAGALGVGAGVASNLVTTKYSREAELEADHYGMQYMVKAGYDPKGAVSLQKTFVTLFEKQAPNWLEGLFATHPPSQDRYIANLKHAQALPGNLNLGTERFAQKISLLKKRQDAYKTYDEGLKAFKKGNYIDALNASEKAIKQEPQEALFYGLKGDSLAKQNHKEKALGAYDAAIALDKHYFYYFHQRGLLLQQMGRKAEAKKDLSFSQQLLPTQTAQNMLNQLNA